MIEISAVEPDAKASGDNSIRVDSEVDVRTRYESYFRDESSFGPGNAQIAFFPTSERQVSDFLKEMNSRKIPVTISGARTGIVGGAVPIGGALMSLERMNRILGVKWNEKAREWTMTAQPGIRLSELEDRIAKKDLKNDQTDPLDMNWEDLSNFINDSHPYFYAPDPTEQSASLGGTVATDASGARTYFYGRTRTHVRAIRVVLPTGDVLALRRGENQLNSSHIVRIKCLDGSVLNVPIPSYHRPDVKCASGYFSQEKMDLIDLFIGSEGTLGVITSVELALTSAPANVAMFLAFFSSMELAVGFVQYMRSLKFVKEPLIIHSIEYFDSNSLNLIRYLIESGELPAGAKLPADSASTAILSEFAYSDAVEAVQLLQTPLEKFGSSLESAVSGLDQRDRNSLKALRHAVPETINGIIARRKNNVPAIHKIGTDTAVPDTKLELMMKHYSERLKASNLEHYVFGHIAENHLHVNIIPRNSSELPEAERLAEELAREAVALGGTVSGEHGIGKLKRKMLGIQYDEAAINQMLATKKALDPNLILDPGNIFAGTETEEYLH